MNDWASGYVTEIGYTHGYYRELSPALMSLALLNQSVRESERRPLRYLELGFGQGLSLNIHAAACPGEYWGTDIIPAHAANARDLAAASGSGAVILDQSFDELAGRDDLPEFDIIALHGIWSWINDTNRAVIVDLIRRKLAIGGRVYVSYNSVPGWTQSVPLRHLLSVHAELGSAPDRGMGERIQAALAFATQVMEAGGQFFQANPAARERLVKMRDADPGYLAHEYFNRDWVPTPFADVAAQMDAAKLTFATSSHLQDSVDILNLTTAGQSLMATLSNVVLRETTRDFLTNRGFRKDIFVKGLQPLQASEQRERMRDRRFILACAPEHVPTGHSGVLAKLELPANAVEPVIAILAEDGHRPKSVGEIEQHRAWKGQPATLLWQTLLLLAASGAVEPAQSEAMTAAARPSCRALNRHILDKARHNAEVGFLASPVTGTGIALGHYDQLFLAAHHAGHHTAEAMAASAWAVLAPTGVVFTRDGKPLVTAEDNTAELAAAARKFLERLPRLTALGIAD